MSRFVTRHLTFANVASALALTVALGTGTAYAAGTVRSGDIVDGQVRAVDLGADAVTTAKIRGAGVKTPDLGTGAVDARVLRDEAVTGGEVADNSLTFTDIAGGNGAGTVNVPVGYVPNGRCQALTLSVTGAVAGDAVVISGRAPIQNGVYFYATDVPADGTVRGGLCNLSGVTQAALSSYPVRIVTFR